MAKGQLAVPLIKVAMAKGQHVVRLTEVEMANALPASHTKEVAMAKGQHVVRLIKVAMAKGQPVVRSTEVAIAKGQKEGLMSETLTGKAITTANQPKKIIRVVSQIHQVPMAACA
jgi:hypothetical protein